MSGLAIEVKIGRDTASPAIQRVLAGLQPGQLRPIVGKAAVSTYKAHLYSLDQSRANTLGGPRTHFYGSAAKGTSFRVVGDEVVVSIASVGIAQRYFGRTIKPVTAKYLTIPARAEAYGKRASEFQDLEVLVGRNGPYALARRAATLISIRRADAQGIRTVGRRGAQGGEILFWLKKEVTQQPDPTVLPTEAAVQEAVQKAATAYFDLLISRAGAN